MRCLILGGGGFIELNLGSELIAQGHSVKIFNRSTRMKIVAI
jgi:nucleoside-diphosphate-sugar epimerase